MVSSSPVLETFSPTRELRLTLESIHESWVRRSKVEDPLKVSESRRSRIEVVESVPGILASEEKDRIEVVIRRRRARIEGMERRRLTQRGTSRTRSCGTETIRACSIRVSARQASRSSLDDRRCSWRRSYRGGTSLVPLRSRREGFREAVRSRRRQESARARSWARRTHFLSPSRQYRLTISIPT